MKRLILICIFILFLASVYGLCEEGQIDINSASAEELDGLYGIGPVKADSIIDSRPFKSVDELINVSGIGNITLEKIKEQGLACVNIEEDVEETTEEEVAEENTEENKTEVTEEESSEESTPKITENAVTEKDNTETAKQNITAEVIKLTPLTPQNIKSNKDNQSLDNSNYAKYGFIAFCILLGLLFLIRRKNRLKNEFKQKRQRDKGD